jgi:hypothetical protein
MRAVSPEEIPNFVTARSAQALRVAMLRNNARFGIMFHYFDIQFAEGKWIAWFFHRIDLRTDPILKGGE